MIAEILNSQRILLDDLKKLLADVSDDLFFAQPVPDMNPPAWIVGHLVYSCQMIGGEIGLTPWMDEAWVQAFATALALLPVILRGDRPGHEIEHPMAIVIVGGLLTSTVMNLLVMPALYARFGRSPQAAAQAGFGSSTATG